MMEKYDKSLVEAWEWKDKIYRDVKDLTSKDYLKKLRDDAEKILAANKIKLTAVSLKTEKQFEQITEY